jgi:hypothetical protein
MPTLPGLRRSVPFGPGQHALVVLARLGWEAFDVGERRAVEEEDPVELGLRRQIEEVLDLVVGNAAAKDVVGLHHFRPVEWRLDQPPLTVAADPGRIRQLAQSRQSLERPRAGRAVVATEEPAVDPEVVCLCQDTLERGHVAVDVVEDAQHGR